MDQSNHQETGPAKSNRVVWRLHGRRNSDVSEWRKLPSQVKSIVEDCGYTSIIDELTYQAKAMFNLPKWPLIPSVALTATIKAGYNVFDASAITALHKNTRPILFIHGSKDKFVPTSMVYQNYRAATKSRRSCGSLKGQGTRRVFLIISKPTASELSAGLTQTGEAQRYWAALVAATRFKNRVDFLSITWGPA